MNKTVKVFLERRAYPVITRAFGCRAQEHPTDPRQRKSTVSDMGTMLEQVYKIRSRE